MAHFTISAPPQRLREGDTVEFNLAGKVITYTVVRLHKDGNAGKIALKQEGTAPNREVFTFLGMGTEDVVYDFAATAFGYTPDGGEWPWADVADFAAQVRLVWALYGALATYRILHIIN
jgi:hypothetical protein